MPPVRVKGIKRYREPKTGRTYCYHRASKTRIEAEFGTPAFFTELQKVDEAWKAKKPRGGTLGHLIDAYKGTPEFKRLAPRTKDDYEKVFAYLVKLRPMPVSKLTPSFVVGLRNKAFDKHKRRFANYVVQVISRVCTIGKPLELIGPNPAEGIGKVLKATGERNLNRPWSLQERQAVIAAAPPHLAAPIALGRYLGVRLGDMVAMTPGAYRGGYITFVTGKSGTEVTVPVPVPLAAAIAGMKHKGKTRLFLNSFGEPWTKSGFSSSFRKHVLQLLKEGKVRPGLTFHGLRHSVATDLREAGYENRNIADVLGQKTESVVAVYTAKADMRKQNAKVLNAIYEHANSLDKPDVSH
jgi:integrase